MQKKKGKISLKSKKKKMCIVLCNAGSFVKLFTF